MVAQPAPMAAVFFDIGGTLGNVSQSPLKLTLLPSTRALLKTFHQTLGLKLGVISNIPETITTVDIVHMLDAAGLHEFFPPELIVTSRDGHGGKPAASIYQFAATKAGLPPARCLYIGEDPAEVAGAITGGMSGILRV